jgi:hypothetical protein
MKLHDAKITWDFLISEMQLLEGDCSVDSDCGHLGCYTVLPCRQMPTFRRYMLPPSSWSKLGFKNHFDPEVFDDTWD